MSGMFYAIRIPRIEQGVCLPDQYGPQPGNKSLLLAIAMNEVLAEIRKLKKEEGVMLLACSSFTFLDI